MKSPADRQGHYSSFVSRAFTNHLAVYCRLVEVSLRETFVVSIFSRQDVAPVGVRSCGDMCPAAAGMRSGSHDFVGDAGYI